MLNMMLRADVIYMAEWWEKCWSRWYHSIGNKYKDRGELLM